MDTYSYLYPETKRTAECLAYYMCGNLDMPRAIYNLYEDIINYLNEGILDDKNGGSAPDKIVLERIEKLRQRVSDWIDYLGDTQGINHLWYLQGELKQMHTKILAICKQK